MLITMSWMKSIRSNVRGRVTPSIEAMFQHQAKRSEFLSIVEPGAVHHPGWVGRALSTYHQKHRTTRLVEGFIDKISLRGNKGDKYSDRGISGGGLHQCVVFRMSQEGQPFDRCSSPVLLYWSGSPLDLNSIHNMTVLFYIILYILSQPLNNTKLLTCFHTLLSALQK